MLILKEAYEMVQEKQHHCLPFQSAKKTMAALLILFLLSSTFIACAQEMGTVTAKVVLRKSASQSASILVTLGKGDRVVILGVSGDWYKVNYGKHTGYIMKKYITLGRHSIMANSASIASLGAAPGPMRIGDTGDDVSKLQRALKVLGYYSGRIDGSYGHETTVAVISCQKDNGLEADGVAGRETVRAIFGSVGKGTTQPVSKPKESTLGSTAQASASGNQTTITSISELGSAPSPSKEGERGAHVKKLQQALAFLGYYSGNVDGSYGAQTVEAVKRLQRNRGMKQDGIAGIATIRVIFGETAAGTTSTASKTTSTQVAKKTELLDWFADNVSRLIPKGAKFRIKDIRTGRTFYARRWSGFNHLDAEPASAEDTATLKKILGGAWSWDRRPILIQYNGHIYAASMNGMPHGTTTINTGFNGHFCIHFRNSMTHESGVVDTDHQKAINTAGKASW